MVRFFTILILAGIISLFSFKKLNTYLATLSNHQSPVRDAPSHDTGRIITKNFVIYHGDRSKKQIALTFDADMTSGMERMLKNGQVKSFDNTEVINYLIDNKIKATFFLTGMWIEEYPSEAKNLASNPLFEIGNHSYSHQSFAGKCYKLGILKETQFQNEINKTQELIKSLGVESHYFRFPGGCASPAALDVVKKDGIITVFWDSVGNDGFNNNTQSIVNNVLKTAQNGSIIVLHSHGGPNAPKTAIALPLIIKALREKGFSFVKLSEI